MLPGQAHILVHVEGDHILEGHFPRFVHGDQALVHTQRRRTGGQAQYKGAVLLVVIDGVSNVLRSPFAHCIVVVLNDQFHMSYPFAQFDGKHGIAPICIRKNDIIL